MKESAESKESRIKDDKQLQELNASCLPKNSMIMKKKGNQNQYGKTNWRISTKNWSTGAIFQVKLYSDSWSNWNQTKSLIM